MLNECIEVAPSRETESRKREVQLLINVAEPDPEYQPALVTDEASLLDVVLAAPAVIQLRLNAYFGAEVDLQLGLPLWRLVDRVKQPRPGWPDDQDEENAGRRRGKI